MAAGTSSDSSTSSSSDASSSSDEDERHRRRRHKKKKSHKRKRGHSKPDKKRKKGEKDKKKSKKKRKKAKTEQSGPAIPRVESAPAEAPEGPPKPAVPLSTAALLALAGERADAGLMPAAAVQGPPAAAAPSVDDDDGVGYLDDLDEECDGASFTQLLQREKGLKFEPDRQLPKTWGGGEEVGPVQPERWNEPAPKMTPEAVAAFMRGEKLQSSGASLRWRERERERPVDRGMVAARAQQEAASSQGWNYA